MNPTPTGIAVALAVSVAFGFFAFGTPLVSELASTDGVEDTVATTTSSELPMDLSLAPGDALPTELVITDVVEGSGPEAAPGQMVTVHYVGALPDGTVFDASTNRGEPFTFQLGAGQVIRGWDEGVAGMKVGGKRRLVIPPDMAYGNQAVGGVIPANATLLFEVELLAVQ